MEFVDLKAQYQILKEEIDSGIHKMLEHGRYIMGPEVFELENKLAEYVGVKHCISCANGTDALAMVLMAWGIGEGDAVFVPAFTFMSTAEVVSLRGATPVFVDIDLDTFNMDSASLEREIEKIVLQGTLKPKAIIPVDLFGLPADYSRIKAIADQYGLMVLEDGAQGFGGSVNGQRACSFGDAATTSFFPAKPLGCYGDGGAIFTDDDETAALLKSIRVHGQGADKYDNVRVGLNSRLDTLQAAILLPKFKAFVEYELAYRDRWAAEYTKRLSGLVKTPTVPQGMSSCWAQYSILLESREQRDKVKAALKEAGIPSMVYYTQSLHLQMAYAHLGYRVGDLPVSEDANARVLCLPMHPYLDEEQVGRVCGVIEGVVKG